MIEKKYIAIIILALALAMIPACANKSGIGAPNDQTDSLPISGFSADLSSNASLPPANAKTFLICPDGAPVYVSEISEMYSGNSETNDKKTLTLPQAENAARNRQDFKVKCEGFAYGYLPEPSFDRESSPEKFVDANTGMEHDRSSKFIRVKTGDKFGTLTVKNAQSSFNTNWNLNSLSNAPGAYYSGSLIEYDGEIELTGHATEQNGSLTFYPDGNSITKIPYTSFRWDNDKKELCHSQTQYENWCGDYYICDLTLPNTADNAKPDILEAEDGFARVKVTLSDIAFERDLLGSQSAKATLKSITAI